MKYRILIVEDDPVIAGAVKRQIEAWGCEARTAENFADVTADFRSFAPHLVLMDIGLPLYDGYHWCAEIRKISRVPVIFLSSASDNMNILMALNMGGDDFIAKPFDLNVLTAKVQALLRRTYDFAVQSEVLECGGAVLHPDEPTGALDSKSADQLMRLFDGVNAAGQTILMVTHSIRAASHASRVLFIKDGQVFHQLYRGQCSADDMFQRISDTLTTLATGGVRHE